MIYIHPTLGYSIETVKSSKSLEQSNNLSLQFTELGDTECHHEHPLGVCQSLTIIDTFVHLASDTSSLYHILKQSDIYSKRYCIYNYVSLIDL